MRLPINMKYVRKVGLPLALVNGIEVRLPMPSLYTIDGTRHGVGRRHKVHGCQTRNKAFVNNVFSM